MEEFITNNIAILIAIFIFLITSIWLYKFICALRDQKKHGNPEKLLNDLPENDAKNIFLEEKLKKREKESLLKENQKKNNKENLKKLLPICEKFSGIKDLLPPKFDFDQKFEDGILNIFIDERSLADYARGFELSVNITNDEETDGGKFLVTETINKPLWFRFGPHLFDVPQTSKPKLGKEWTVARFAKHSNWMEKTFSNYEDTIKYIRKRIVEETGNKLSN
jgi:hypothetical protein